jgi:hypothetical protein
MKVLPMSSHICYPCLRSIHLEGRGVGVRVTSNWRVWKPALLHYALINVGRHSNAAKSFCSHLLTTKNPSHHFGGEGIQLFC